MGQPPRWLTPDPAGLAAVDPTNPQTWNRYAYVMNNPLSYVDPLGLQVPGPGQCSIGGDSCTGGGSPGGSSWAFVALGWNEDGDPWGLYFSFTQQAPGPGNAFCYYSLLCGGSSAANNGGLQNQPCRITDPVLGALEFTVKLGPEVQLGPVKAGLSLYNNLTSGGTGGKGELNAGLFSVQADNPTPPGGSFNGGGPGNIQYSASFLGFQYNFTTSEFSFSPSKSFTLGLQALVGGEVSFNSDTYQKLSVANQACAAQGGK